VTTSMTINPPATALWAMYCAAAQIRGIPLDKIDNLLIILGATLIDRDVLREIQRLSGCQIYQYVGTWTDIRQAIDRLFKKEGDGEDLTSLGKLLLNEEETGEPPAAITPPAAPPQPQAPPAPAKPRKGLLNLFRKK